MGCLDADFILLTSSNAAVHLLMGRQLSLHAVWHVQCQPWFVNWLRPRAAAVQILDTTFSSDDSHRLELLLSLLGRCATIEA